MGVAAYQRGTLVIRRQHDEQAEQLRQQLDLAYFKQMARDADRLQEGIKEMSDRFHYFFAAGWYREANIARLRGWHYRRQRNKIVARLRNHGFSAPNQDGSQP